jgi:hypothetical protein
MGDARPVQRVALGAGVRDIAFSPRRSHNDGIVHQVQQHIDLHLDQPLRTGELASTSGISSRSLSRRCPWDGTVGAGLHHVEGNTVRSSGSPKVRTNVVG